MKQLLLVRPHSADSGYAAIVSILVILAIITLVGLTTSYLGIGNAQMGLGQNKSEASITLVETCIEDALLKYNNTGSIPTSVTTPEGNCNITLDASTATSATFTTAATLGNYTHSISTTANRATSVTVVNWTQIN